MAKIFVRSIAIVIVFGLKKHLALAEQTQKEICAKSK